MSPIEHLQVNQYTLQGVVHIHVQTVRHLLEFSERLKFHQAIAVDKQHQPPADRLVGRQVGLLSTLALGLVEHLPDLFSEIIAVPNSYQMRQFGWYITRDPVEDKAHPL